MTPRQEGPEHGRRLRVLQVISHVGLGGAENVCRDLMHALSNDFDYGLFAPGGLEAGCVGRSYLQDLRSRGIPVYLGQNAVPVKYGGLLLAGVRAAAAMRRFRPDVVHMHTEYPEASIAAAFALWPPLRRNTAVVKTIHSSVYWSPWRRTGVWCEARHGASHVACVSEVARAAYMQFRQESGLGPPVHEPRVIPNGVTLPKVGPRQTPAADRVVRIMFGGRLRTVKGVDLIPEIVRRVDVPPGVRCELSVHGHGPLEPELRAFAAAAPPAWVVRIEGMVPSLLERIPEFDLAIMPSRFEGCPLGAIEALLLGVPVVASRADGLRDVFRPGYPWLAEPGNASDFASVLSRAIRQRQLWKDEVESAQALIRERYSPERMASSYADLYRSAANARGDAPVWPTERTGSQDHAARRLSRQEN